MKGVTMERWLNIENFPKHQVSSLGRVRNWTTGVILKPRPSGWGYLQVILYQGGQTHTKSVHRLVAEAFFEGDGTGLEVNHIDSDGDKTHNFVGNLEWVTKGQNNKHAIDVGLRQPRRGITVEIVETGQSFNTLQKAADFVGGNIPGLRYALNVSSSNRYKGYTFRYGN